ncbi:MAG: sugar kinase [Lachnospiraceae bacterium]|nr:sugar kinase [Lachnospiraceae bacterium]
MPEVVTIGETMVVFDSVRATRLRYCTSFKCRTGGAETNTAVALTRLGHTAGWISRLGEDEFGHKIINLYWGEGVDVSHAELIPGEMTGVFFRQRLEGGENKNFYYRKGSAASKIKPEDLDEDYIADAKILFVSGITLAISEDACRTVERAMQIAKEHGVMVVFDPNLRLKVWSLEQAKKTIDHLMPYVDIALPGIEEGELLYGTSDPDEVARIIRGYGVKTVVIKVGADGCIGYDDAGKHVSKGFHVKNVVDAFGAGDGFAAGILAGVLENLSPEETMKLANAVGAITVSMNGNIEAYPTRKEVEDYVSGNQEINR